MTPDPFWLGLTESEFNGRYRASEEQRLRLARERTRNDELAVALFRPWITALGQLGIEQVLADVTLTGYQPKEKP